MTSIKKELWNIFTYYSLHGNPRDPSKLTSVAFHKLCRDIMVFDATMTERPISTTDINLIYQAEQAGGASSSTVKASGSTAVEKSDKLSFEEFLTCLTRIARKCYPSFSSSEASMRQLLLDNVLPLANRRSPVSIAPIISSPPVVSLFTYYEDALMTMFKFYSSSSDSKGRGRSLNTTGRTFDEQKELIKDAREATFLHNSMANSLSHSDFVRFTNDYGLLNAVGLTHLDLGEIYLSIIAFDNFSLKMRFAEFGEFWEAFVRMAIIAFRYSQAPIENKIKAMFSYIWKYLQSTILDSQSSVSQQQGFNTYKAGLIGASQVLNEKFLNAWKKDDYLDYLANYSKSSSSKGAVQEGKGAMGGFLEKDENLAFLHELAVDLDMDDASKEHKSLAKQVEEIEDDSGISHLAAINHHLASLSCVSSGAAASSETISKEAKVAFDIEDTADFEDPRITPVLLRQLLTKNPNVARILHKAMLNEGVL